MILKKICAATIDLAAVHYLKIPKGLESVADATDRLPDIMIEGHITRFNPSDKTVEFKLTKGETSPLIIATIKVCFELMKKVRYPIKSSKSAPTQGEESKRIKRAVHENLKKLINQHCGSADVERHVLDCYKKAKDAKNKETALGYLDVLFQMDLNLATFGPLVLDKLSLLVSLEKFNECKEFAADLFDQTDNKCLKEVYQFYFVFASMVSMSAMSDEHGVKLLMQLPSLISSLRDKDSVISKEIPNEIKQSLLDKGAIFLDKNLKYFIEKGHEGIIYDFCEKCLQEYELIKSDNTKKAIKIKQKQLIQSLIKMLHIAQVDYSKIVTLIGLKYLHILDYKDALGLQIGLGKQKMKNESADKSFIENCLKNEMVHSDTLIVHAAFEKNRDVVSQLLQSAIKKTKENKQSISVEVYPLLINCILNHPLDDALLTGITKLHTSQDHIQWLLTATIDHYDQFDTEDASNWITFSKVCKKVLNSMCKNTPIDMKEIESLIQEFSPITNLNCLWKDIDSKPDQVKTALFELLFQASWTDCMTWVGKQVEFDEDSHFRKLNLSCATGQEHIVHLQKHSVTHISGSVKDDNGKKVEVKNTKSKKEKTRLNSDININDLIKQAWKTFNPKTFNDKLDDYWRVQFSQSIAKNLDVLAIEIKQVEEGTYSLKFNPTSDNRIDGYVN